MKIPFRPILSARQDAFAALAAMDVVSHIALQKRGGRIEASIALENHPDDDLTLLAACGFSMGAPVAVSLPRGVSLARCIERRSGKVSRNSLGVTGRKFISMVRRPAKYETLIRSMKNGDHIHLRVAPLAGVLPCHPAFSDETNAAFSGRCCSFSIEVSRAAADSLLTDLSATGASFCLCDSGSADRSGPVHSHIITCDEYGLLAAGFGEAVADLIRPDIRSCMSPAQAVNLPAPEIIIGETCGVPVGFSFNDILTNVSIAGLSSSGKTTLAKSIIAPLHDTGIATVVLSPVKYDFSHAFAGMCDLYRAGDDAYPLRLSLLENMRRETVGFVADALAHITPMGEDGFLPMIYKNTLDGLLAYDDEISLADFARAASTEHELSGYASGREGRSLQQAIINRPRTAYGMPEFSCSRSSLDFDRMLSPGALTVIELHDMMDSGRRAFATVFLQRLIQAYRKNIPLDAIDLPLRLVIVCDELHELFSGPPDQDPFRASLISSMSTARGLGVGHILMDQRLSVLGELATHASANQILLNNPITEQAAAMLDLPMDSDMIQTLPYLSSGHGLLHIARQKTIPFIGRKFTPTAIKTSAAAVRRTPYCPYKACEAVCSNCDLKLHRAIQDAVSNQLSGISSAYRMYVCAARDARKHTDPQQRRQALQAANSMLFKACRDAAVRKAQHAGIDIAAKQSVMIHCTKHELYRQLAFRI